MNAQGEDVVAGIRTPQNITEEARKESGSDKPSLEAIMPEVFAEFRGICETLERHYRDMQDVEFTIQEGKLWMLQCRNGKRTTPAALKVAVDMAREGLISKEEAITRIEAVQLDQLLHPTIDPSAVRKIMTTGLPASPGAACGEIVFSPDDAEKLKAARQDRDPRAHGDEPRGYSRHARGGGHSHGTRRHDEPRGGGCARHGPSLRIGRQRLAHRP